MLSAIRAVDCADSRYLGGGDPETGAHIGELALTFPPGGAPGGADTNEFGGLLGLAQHPVTGVLYGIRKPDDSLARELVTINPLTGATTLVGSMGMHMTSIAFVPAILITSITKSGSTLNITWTGTAQPPFSLQKKFMFGWTTIASGLSGPSTTTPVTGSEAYYRIISP